MKKARTNKYYALLEGWMSVSVNVVLFAIKLWAGIVTSSVAVIADAWHTLSDSLTSIIVLVGAKISTKPADKEHPYGHERAEILVTFIIGIFLIMVGFNFILEAYKELQSGEAAIFGKLALWVMILSTIIKEISAQVAIRLGKKTRMNSLIADGFHHRSDAISSAIIVVGILAGKSLWWMDGVMAILVSLSIFFTAYHILKNAIKNLMGEKPSDELARQIKTIAEEEVGFDIQMHHLLLHQYGSHQEVTFHIKLNSEMNLHEAHEIASDIEKALFKNIGVMATVHLEPQDGEELPPLIPVTSKTQGL